MSITLNEIRKYQKPIRGPIGKLLDKVFIFVPWMAVNMKISANLVTLIAFMLDAIAVNLLLKGWFSSVTTSITFPIAAILIILSYVGDISDGTVARYEREVLKKPRKGYGQYLDEALGTLGFALVVFAAGAVVGGNALGVFSMLAVFMMNITTAEAKLSIPNKKEISESFQKHKLSNKYQIGFTCDIQRTLVALAVFFNSWILMTLFAILGNLLWFSKFFLYRKS